MRWGVLWDFAGDGTDRWLDDVLGEGRHSFVKMSARQGHGSWHQGISARSSIGRWFQNGARHLDRQDIEGIITVFPPLAVTTALINRFHRRRLKHVAWAFNLGHHPRGLKRWAASAALAGIDCIVVHSSGEVDAVRELFSLQEHQVKFVHLQGPARPVLADEETAEPFVVSIGSANRDYATLIAALEITGIPAKIVAASRIIDKLPKPKNVEFLSGLDWESCLQLTQQARISVIPIADPTIASGQVTIVDALTMGRPVLTTRSIGTVDYVQEGSTGVLVEPGDVKGMAQALQRLWDDEGERRRLAAAGRRFAEATLSDPVIARRFGEILDEVQRAPVPEARKHGAKQYQPIVE